MSELTPQQLTDETLAYIEHLRLPDAPYGRYHYAQVTPGPALYASSQAAMTRHLHGELDALGLRQRREWIGYLQGHQDEDGLFRDPAIYDQGSWKGDPLWSGRPHLTHQVVTALTCLGAVADKPLRWLDLFCDGAALRRWLEERDWGERVAWSGNEIMNVGCLLQYARDFQGNRQAGDAVRVLLDWLSTQHVNPDTGVWGSVDITDPQWRSHAVQAAYHWWPVFFYDRTPIPYPEAAVDTLLQTQNPRGGFGWGVHNCNDPYLSSACEDIDSIDPLSRIVAANDYRRADILEALHRALPWVLSNRNPDGGLVFARDLYWPTLPVMDAGGPNCSELSSTWFRTLCLAIMGQVLPDTVVGRVQWRFCDCPGFAFLRL